jgi:hypothetical protein
MHQEEQEEVKSLFHFFVRSIPGKGASSKHSPKEKILRGRSPLDDSLFGGQLCLTFVPFFEYSL